MSGHSKWATTHRDKEKTDQQRGKIFTKIGREIAIAVKQGGPDPSSNPRLATVIIKAKANNMPNDNIQRSIKKASGELNAVNYEEMVYEGYGPGGSAFMLDVLTDNKNRAAADIRHIFDRAGGSLGGPGSVAYLFNRKAVITVQSDSKTEDDVMELVMENNGDDVQTEDGGYFTIYAEPTELNNLKKAFEADGYKIESAGLEMVPTNTISLDDSKYASFEKLIDNLEESDDVQNVYHNVALRDEE